MPRFNRLVETNLKPYRKDLCKIRQLDLSGLSAVEMTQRLESIRQTVRSDRDERAGCGDCLPEVLPELFALVCAAVQAEFGWSVFDSQLLAALAMQRGHVAELDTGEGKTLVAVFVACLNALTGKGVHVLTFNDYLASRDAEWMRPIYQRLGFEVAVVQSGQSLSERRQAYAADITYLTAKEAGFDYLRGFLAGTPADLVQRPFHYAVVDEADSILIDEARIPLVIAGGSSTAGSIDPALYRVVTAMQLGRHYRLDEFAEHILITEAGAAWLERRLSINNLYDEAHVHLQTQVRLILQAEALLRRDVDYLVRDGSIQLIDEFTGRVIQNRQWPEGLHEAVEIKEGLSSRSRGRILNRITLRDFLALYPGLCGMTGTACSAAAELNLFYGLRVTRIPPHVPCRRIDRPDLVFRLQSEKEQAIVTEIRRRHQAGQPVLVGTASVAESEQLAEQVRAAGLPCVVLNARSDATEAAVIAQAGQCGAITLSTNMAGRGVDIRLEDPGKGGLFVIGTNRHRSVRIDNQLRGRAGRQGDPGESCFYVSLQDDLIERYQIRTVLPPAYQNLPPAGTDDAGPIGDRAVIEAIDHTQRVVEGQLFQQRQALARYSLLVEEQRRLIHQLRQDFLTGAKRLEIWQSEAPLQTAALMRATSADDMQKAQQTAGALLLGQGWADYLELVDQLLDHVAMMRSGPNDPFTAFNRQVIDAYAHLLDTFETDLIELLDKLLVADGKINLSATDLQAPPTTRTYLIDDGSDTLDQTLGISNLVAAAANPGFFLLSLAARRQKRLLDHDKS
jgi:preprotein translocase subunit SecA